MQDNSWGELLVTIQLTSSAVANEGYAVTLNPGGVLPEAIGSNSGAVIDAANITPSTQIFGQKVWAQ